MTRKTSKARDRSDVIATLVRDARRAQELMARCPRYAVSPTLELPDVARAAGVARVVAKDERARFGLGAFKALGAPYAMLRDAGGDAEMPEALTGEYVTASAGNHGAAVAATARAFGARATIFLPDSMSGGRRAFLEALGAQVIETPGGFEDAVAAAKAHADEAGAVFAPDVGEDAPDSFARRVVEGYGVLSLEFAEQLRAADIAPTHLFVQGGVGGLAAGAAGVIAGVYGADARRLVVVEAEGSACVKAAWEAGRVVAVEHRATRAMEMMDCAEASEAAMGVLWALDLSFVVLGDDEARAACWGCRIRDAVGDGGSGRLDARRRRERDPRRAWSRRGQRRVGDHLRVRA